MSPAPPTTSTTPSDSPTTLAEPDLSPSPAHPFESYPNATPSAEQDVTEPNPYEPNLTRFSAPGLFGSSPTYPSNTDIPSPSPKPSRSSSPSHARPFQKISSSRHPSRTQSKRSGSSRSGAPASSTRQSSTRRRRRLSDISSEEGEDGEEEDKEKRPKPQEREGLGIGSLVREFNDVDEGISNENKEKLGWRERRRLAREERSSIRSGSLGDPGGLSRRETEQSGVSQGSRGSRRHSLRRKLSSKRGRGSGESGSEVEAPAEAQRTQEAASGEEGGSGHASGRSTPGGLETVVERPKPTQRPSSIARPPPAPSHSIARQLSRDERPSQPEQPSSWGRFFGSYLSPSSQPTTPQHRRNSSEDDENARVEPEPITTSRHHSSVSHHLSPVTQRIRHPLSASSSRASSDNESPSLPTHNPPSRPDPQPNGDRSASQRTGGSEISLNPRHAHPKLNQDLNQPFIPRVAGYNRHGVARRFFDHAIGHIGSLEPGPNANRTNNEIDSEAPLHTIAALIATTGNLTGAMSPAIASIAPVWSYEDQGDKQGGSGGRRLSRYSRREAKVDLAGQKEVEDEFRSHEKKRERRDKMVKRRDEREQRSRSRRVKRMTGHDATEEDGHKTAYDPENPRQRVGRSSSQIDPDAHNFRDASRLKHGADDKKNPSSSSPRPSSPTEPTHPNSSKDATSSPTRDEIDAETADKGEATENQLDDIQEEGVNDILRTEGADANAFEGDYDAGGQQTLVPTPSSSDEEEEPEPNPPSTRDKLARATDSSRVRRRESSNTPASKSKDARFDDGERSGSESDESNEDWNNSSEEDSLANDSDGPFDWSEHSGLSDEEKRIRRDRDAEKGDVGRSWREKKRWGMKAGKYAGWVGSKRGERMQQEIYIKSHRGTDSQTRDFIVRLANAMMVFGAPTHRLEKQLEATARVLECDAHFFYLPSHLILCFNDPAAQHSETAFLRAVGALDSEKLAQVHAVNREVIHDVISASEGSLALKQITAAPPLHPVWMRIIIIGACSFFGSAVAFSGSFIDMFGSFVLGALMGTCQLTLAASNPLFLNCFEITMAFLVSFLAKALAATGVFCYQSLVSAGIIMILPGYVILGGALELASRSIVAGSIRLVYGCVLSLFLGVGISLGSKVYTSIDVSQKESLSSVQLTGTFNSTDPTQPNPLTEGTFTFVDSSSTDAKIVCDRAANAPWYQQTIPDWYLFIIVPCFIIALGAWTKAKLRSNQFYVSFVIACVAYAVYYFAKGALPDQPEVSAAIGSFVIGIGGTLWSRVARGTSYTTQSAAILLLVPNGLAAAGGLAMTSSSGQTSFEMGTQIALRQIEVAIGITIGLFASSLCTYAWSRKKRGAFFTY